MAEAYCPERGDVVWISFSPQAGHEQAGDRPAIVLSPRSYNQKTGVAIFCPITSQMKGYSFEVKIPPGYKVSGTILSDHVKSLDWRIRRTRYYCELPEFVAADTAKQVGVLIGIDLRD